MDNAIPDAVRSEILRLDMHDCTAAEIVHQTGVKRSTITAIINRTRGPRESKHRGDVTVLYDPTGTFKVSARFNFHDLEAMARFSKLADGTLFEVKRRDGSIYIVEMQSGKLTVDKSGRQW